MACDILLKRFWWGLQLCCKPHCDRRFAREIMGPQTCENPRCGKFGTPLGSPETKCHLDVAPMETRKKYYKGEGGGFPQVWVVMSLVSLSCPRFVLAPKVLQLCINHLVLVLCRSGWVVKACQFFLVPSQSSSTPLYPSKVLRTRERALIPCFSVVFYLKLTIESFKELGARQWDQRHNFIICKIFKWCKHWRGTFWKP